MVRLIPAILIPAIPLLASPLLGCSFNQPPPAPTAARATYEACRQEASRVDAARHYAYLSRTDQMSTPLSGLPDQRYVNNRLADLHEYDDRINRCVQNGNQETPSSDAGLPEPQIIGPVR